MKSRPPLLGFRVSIALVLVCTVALMAISTVAIVVLIGSDAARKNAEALFSRMADTVSERTESLFRDPISLARYAALNRDAAVAVVSDGLDHPFLSFMRGALAASPTLYSLYLGASDGSFLQLIQTNSDSRILQAHNAPAGTLYILRTIHGASKSRLQSWTFLGVDKVLGRRVDDASAVTYNPVDRPWYQNAVQSGNVVLSEPYTFNSLQEQGVTASIALKGGHVVVGVDMTLGDLQKFIDAQQVSPHGGVILVDGHKSIMAKSSGFERRPGWLVKNVNQRLAGQDLEIILTAPPEDFGAEFQTMELSVVVATLLLLLLLLPLTLLFTKRLTKIMTVLSEDVDRVCRLDFTGEAPQGSRIRENSTASPEDSQP